MISHPFQLRALFLSLGFLAMVAGPVNFSRADIQQIVILTDRGFLNGNTANSTYEQRFMVLGAGISGITVTPPGQSTPIDLSFAGAGNNGLVSFEVKGGETYTNLTDLRAAFPLGLYTFAITNSDAGHDSVELLFNPLEPNSFVFLNSPTPGASDIPYSSVPEFSWNGVTDDSEFFRALGCELRNTRGESVDQATPYDLANTTWTPTAIDRLLPNTTYDFNLSLYQAGTANPNPQTVGGDAFTYYGVFGHTGANEFATALPEPGSAALLAVAFSVLFGRVTWRRRG